MASQCNCGKAIPETETRKFTMEDIQKNEIVEFCSLNCMREWVSRKRTAMWASIVIGVILSVILMFQGEIFFGVIVIFLPYMIRHAFGRLGGLFSSGTIGEIFSFIIVLLATITIVYPVYKFIQEFKQYQGI